MKQINLKKRKLKNQFKCTAIVGRNSMDRWLAAKINTVKIYGFIEIVYNKKFFHNFGIVKIADYK